MSYDENVFESLLADYHSLKSKLWETEEALRKARDTRREAVKGLQDAEKDYNEAESALILLETHKQGFINGSNDFIRGLQKIELIARETRKGGGLFDEYTRLQSATSIKLKAEDDEKSAIDRFSAVRYAARMQAGTANALA